MSDLLAFACPDLRVSLLDGVLTLSLDTPEPGNRLTPALVNALADLWPRIAVNESVRVVVLTGAGEDFSRGLDTSAFHLALQEDLPRTRSTLESLHQTRERVLKLLPQPVIGVVQGACHGGGLRLIEGCDIVLAADDAEFIFTSDDASLLACHPAAAQGPTWLPDTVVASCLPQGRRFTSQEAVQFGWVTQCHARDQLDPQVQELAQALALKDALALQFTKETVAHVGTMSWDAAVNYTAAKFAELKSRQAGSPSTRASAVQSFLAGKSKPGLGG